MKVVDLSRFWILHQFVLAAKQAEYLLQKPSQQLLFLRFLRHEVVGVRRLCGTLAVDAISAIAAVEDCKGSNQIIYIRVQGPNFQATHSEMAASKDIVVFGATGTIGKYIIEALINAKASFGRLGAFTSANTVESKASYVQALKEQGVEIIVGDITSEADVAKAYERFDTVVSAVGRNVIAAQIELLRLAESTPNIKRFFPSEYGTDIEFGPKSPREKPHQLKLKVRAYIKEEIKRLQYTYLVTGPYADGYIGKGFGDGRAGSFDVPARKAVLLGSGGEKVAMMTMNE